jgi:hypothetical protein
MDSSDYTLKEAPLWGLQCRWNENGWYNVIFKVKKCLKQGHLTWVIKDE